MSLVPARELEPGVVLHAPDRHDQQGSPRPWVHPIATPQGVVATADRPDDHPWHRGLSLAVSNLTTPDGLVHNFWGGPTFTGSDYEQIDNNGAQLVLERRVDRGHSREVLDWRTADGRSLVSEEREITVSTLPTGMRLEWSSVLTASPSEPLRFGSPTTAGRPAAGYGGLFLRAAPELLGAEVLLDGVLTPPDEAMGATAHWAAVRTPSITVAMADDNANPVTTSPWFVRVEPVVMLCAAPFFHSEWLLAAGESATWRWTVLVIDGAPSADELDAMVGQAQRP